MAEEEYSQLAVSLPRTASRPRYEGPFDLLLALIRRNEYDIDALPVVEITSQFLAYVQAARDLDTNLAGEFVEAASWLVLLKSRGLLPPRGDEASPREELRRAILDHQTLRAATDFLRQREGRARPAGAGAPAGHNEAVLEPAGEETPTVQDVLQAARHALEAARAARSLEDSEPGSATVEEMVHWIAARLAALPSPAAVSTKEWFSLQPSDDARAALLLALLELSRKEFLLLYQAKDFGPLLVKPLRAIPNNRQNQGFGVASENR